MTNIKRVEHIKEFDGWLSIYQHTSTACACDMQFSLYLPPQAEKQTVPILYWLSGLTCTDENFRIKAGAQRYAAEYGLALVIPDTSPRGDHVPDNEAYYLGQGAGFYLNATEKPWSKNFRMYDYVSAELPRVIDALKLPIDNQKRAISGHSMGGHGALTLAFKQPDCFVSVSAFSPVCHPAGSDWGQQALTHYLGKDEANWRQYDSCYLLSDGALTNKQLPILIDQGTADEFFPDQLLTHDLQTQLAEKNITAKVRFQTDYDHSFHFVATFIGEHIAWHHRHLSR